MKLTRSWYNWLCVTCAQNVVVRPSISLSSAVNSSTSRMPSTILWCNAFLSYLPILPRMFLMFHVFSNQWVFDCHNTRWVQGPSSHIHTHTHTHTHTKHTDIFEITRCMNMPTHTHTHTHTQTHKHVFCFVSSVFNVPLGCLPTNERSLIKMPTPHFLERDRRERRGRRSPIGVFTHMLWLGKCSLIAQLALTGTGTFSFFAALFF